MSLSFNDLQAIRAIVREEITPVENRLEAVENDVKEIYFMMSDMRRDLSSLKNPTGKSAKKSSSP
jgi:phosphopantetheine adenylyltransferase